MPKANDAKMDKTSTIHSLNREKYELNKPTYNMYGSAMPFQVVRSFKLWIEIVFHGFGTNLVLPVVIYG